MLGHTYVLIMLILGTMAPRPKMGEIQALQTQLQDEPSDTPITPEASRSLEELGV